MSGQLVHFEIPADDTAKAREFWGSLFGWQFEAAPGAPDYHMARIGEQMGGAIYSEPGKKGTRAYFDVEDINAGAARVKELGGEADDPQPVPSMGWFAQAKDTEGNPFAVWQSDENAPVPEGMGAQSASSS